MTKKKLFESNGKPLIVDGKKAYLLLESVSMSECIVLDKETVKKSIEASKPKYSDRVIALLESENSAVIRIIKAGWSKNENYYSSQVLEALVKVIEKQGPIQFVNHLEDGGKLDRKVEEIVSYSKHVWYDKESDSVYALVKFPKEKQDTGWILGVIKEDPEMIGVSIAAAVYITEDYEKDGKTGDRVDGWALFDSADYVVFASAGGQGVEAGKVTESIREKIQEAKKKKKYKWAKSANEVSEDVVQNLEKIEYLIESHQTFFTRYHKSKAYNEYSSIVNSLYAFLYDCAYAMYDSDYSQEKKLEEIEKALMGAWELIKDSEYLKNSDAEYDIDGNLVKKEAINPNNNPTQKGEQLMNLEQFKKEHAEAYVQLVDEITKNVKASFEAEQGTKVTAAEQKVTDLQTQVTTLTGQVDGFKAQEAVREKQVLIAKVIEEEKLDESAVTPKFKEMLGKAKDEAEIREIVKERAQLVKPATATTVVEGEPVTKKTSEAKMDDLIAEALESVQITD